MHWIQQYNFILLDFDGLLVNTEHLHFQAYQKMCLDRGFALQWDFSKYCSIAHTSAEGLRDSIYMDFPVLYKQEPSWSVLYAEKKQAYQDLLEAGQIELMPGVHRFLSFLAEKNIKRCVVTNSFVEQTDLVIKQIPLLKTVPYWVTRRDYALPKPAPDPYLTAIQKYAAPQDRMLGFEDSTRGLESLMAASVEGVLISSFLQEEEVFRFENQGVRHFSSFEELFV